jgi:hypothetical protein
MPIFRIQFVKTLSNSTGHERQVCQISVDIEAADNDKAIVRAKELLRSRGTPDWKLSCFDVEAIPVKAVSPEMQHHQKPSSFGAAAA